MYFSHPGAVFRQAWSPTRAPATVPPGTDGSVPPPQEPTTFRLDQFPPAWTLSAPWATELRRLRLFAPPPDASIPPTVDPRTDLPFWPFLPEPWTLKAPWLTQLERAGFATPPPDASTPPPLLPRVSLVPYLAPSWSKTGAWAEPPTLYLPETYVAPADFLPFVSLRALAAEPWSRSAPWRRRLLQDFTPDASTPPPLAPRIPLAAYLPPSWALETPWGIRTPYTAEVVVVQDTVPFLPLTLLTAAPWVLSAPWRAYLRSLAAFTPDASTVPLQTPPVPLAAFLPPAWSRSGAWGERAPRYPIDTLVVAADDVPFAPVRALILDPWTLTAPWRAYLRAAGAFTPDASTVPLARPRVNFTPFLPPDWTLRAPYQPTPRIVVPPDPVVFNLLRLLEQHPWELTAPWRAMLRQGGYALPDASRLPLSDPAAGRRAWEAITRRAPQPWRIPPVFQPITLIPLGPARILIVPGIATAFLVSAMDVDFTALTSPDARAFEAPLIIVDFTVPSQLADFEVPENEEDA